MSEVFEHNPQDHEDPSAAPTWLVGGLGALVLAVTLMTVTALYYNVKAGELERGVVRVPREEVLELRHRQEAFLAGGWVEVQEQGETVRKQVLPIERAMELVVREYGKKGSG